MGTGEFNAGVTRRRWYSILISQKTETRISCGTDGPIKRKFGHQFLVFTHVTFALTTVAIRHVGAQTNALIRETTVRTEA